MKKIGKIVLQSNAEFLGTPEMKMIRGGYGGGDDPWFDGDDCCAFIDPWTEKGYFCLRKPDLAEFYAGSNGWWACNSQEVKDVCKC